MKSISNRLIPEHLRTKPHIHRVYGIWVVKAGNSAKISSTEEAIIRNKNIKAWNWVSDRNANERI